MVTTILSPEFILIHCIHIAILVIFILSTLLLIEDYIRIIKYIPLYNVSTSRIVIRFLLLVALIIGIIILATMIFT